MVYINQGFDGGNIEVVDSSDSSNLRLRIWQDANSDFYQWFYFSVANGQGQPLAIRIENAGDAAYPGGFEDYNVLVSNDRQQWRRHPTRLVDGVLQIDYTPESDLIYFAYFVPYPLERHWNLIASAQQSPLCSTEQLGWTLDGRAMDLLHFSSSSSKPLRCWLIARQHPGETMAEWWMEGAISLLLDETDPLAMSLRSQCEFYVVPNMNPDGSFRGHLRTNAAGRNLNREWDSPSIEHSPEVLLVKQRIEKVGADFFLDVHGDETLPYCFIAGTEGLHGWDDRQQARLDYYKRQLAVHNADFQTEKGYPAKSPGQANYGMSTAQVARLTGCLAMTLEMPFKDTTATPDPVYGWSTERSGKLAVSCLQALADCVDKNLLR